MTTKLKRQAIFGEGIYSKSAVVTRQRRLNCYLEVRKDGDKSTIVLYGTPGMSLAFNASTPLNFPARGIIGNRTALYEVAGNQILSLSATGTTLFSGTIGTSFGAVGMALNPTQVIVVDGSAGYIYTPSASTVAPIAASFPNGAKSVCQCNGFFLCELPGTNEVFVSALNDGSTWNGLSFFAAVQYTDGVVAVDALGGLVVVFSSGHLEFWHNIGATTEPFQYITNSALEYGLAAVYARAHVADSIVFLMRTREGGVQVGRIYGYQVTPVSTSDVDNILQGIDSTVGVSDATMLVYQQDSHKFVQLTLPSANNGLGRSLLYDVTENTWGETQTGIAPGAGARHIGNFSAVAFSKTFVSDFATGNLYIPSPTVYQDNGNVIPRELVTKTGINDFNRYRVSQLYLDMQTGVGLSNPALQGYDPIVSIERARDMRDFGPARLVKLGKQGQHTTRILTRRWGTGRAFTYRIRMTDPVPFVITAGASLSRMRGRESAAA
jgi:hypothetical protein